MKKYFSIVLSVFVLCCVVVGTAFWIQSFYQSIRTYQSPLDDFSLSPQTTPLSRQFKVVVILVSGLGETTPEALTLPNLTQIRQTGANSVIQSEPPTYSQTSRMTLVSGASPETNGAPPIDLPAEALPLVETDTIFARAHQAQLKTALLGLDDWRRLIPRNYLDETFFVNIPGPEADQIIFENTLLLLKDSDIDLLFVHFTQLETAAIFQGGTTGVAYQQAAETIDGYLGQINKAMDFGRGVLVILGDHGHIESGGYGGAEPEVTRQPIVMVGNTIVPGNYSDIRQTDIAPTLATLLGTAAPTAAQGRILFEMLRMDQQDRIVAQLGLAGQRVEMGQAYLSAISDSSDSLPKSLLADLEQAQRAFDQNNLSGAFQLARLAQETTDAHLATVRANQISQEQRPRLVIAAFLLLVWTIVMWRQRGVYVGVIIIAALITVSLYHILYQLQGFEYSISSIIDFSAVPFSIARRTAVSLLFGGGLILILLILVNEENLLVVLGSAYGFGVLVTYLFALPLFWAFWQNGWAVDWYLPAAQPVFWQITASFEALFAAILGLFLPWPIMLLILFVNLVRRSLDKTQSQPEPDALPGLHM